MAGPSIFEIVDAEMEQLAAAHPENCANRGSDLRTKGPWRACMHLGGKCLSLHETQSSVSQISPNEANARNMGFYSEIFIPRHCPIACQSSISASAGPTLPRIDVEAEAERLHAPMVQARNPEIGGLDLGHLRGKTKNTLGLQLSSYHKLQRERLVGRQKQKKKKNDMSDKHGLFSVSETTPTHMNTTTSLPAPAGPLLPQDDVEAEVEGK